MDARLKQGSKHGAMHGTRRRAGAHSPDGWTHVILHAQAGQHNLLTLCRSGIMVMGMNLVPC